MGNWFTSAFPGSLFTNELFVARPEPGRRHAMLDNALTTHRRDGPSENRTPDGRELRDALTDLFGFDCPTTLRSIQCLRAGKQAAMRSGGNEVDDGAGRGMKVLQWLAAFVLLAASTSSVRAAEPVTGRWAADPAACGSFGAARPLIVTDTAVRWHDDACRITRMYKTGDTVHIQALCWGEGGERSVPVSRAPTPGGCNCAGTG